ncbi:FAD-dependent oxidoreductase [Azospirillum brasilense]|uniref:FAD-dependent oxidoreductase n=1 Tax=Azospirillum brasilense TaxID=192 RepID=UPI000E69D65F|nr:FAD-dependent oxidoreductase [Azospirillum brasilense]NUB26944.1 FAD-dependent oxidoreductase [Azospirillum brasilense]NUB30164.1 FAD-dependent oxidoreductase [Azospirillum brasilense]RIW05018.1 FAD-dependent oxidoreductase [Azospirillum brasilense]
MSRILPADGVTFEFTVPVVVIGGGAAGMIAALAAHERGAEVLVLERDALPQGSTALSAGLIPAPGTRWQRAAGIEDSPERFAADIIAKAKGEPEPADVSRVARAVGPALEWLADRYGLPFSVVDNFTYPGHSARRMHGLPSRSGAELIDRLRGAVEAAGIDVLCEAHVTALYADGPRVRGVEVTRPDGSVERVGCAALILACNGYGGNRALVERHVPELADALYFGHPGNQGDALLWGEALGAATRHLSGHQGHGSVAHPAGILVTWATVTEGGVQVNTAGKRFSNEAQGYSEQAAVVLRQPDGIAWTVFDERIAAVARQFEDFRQAEAMGAVLGADSPADLARLMKIDAAALTVTLAEVDRLKAAGGTDGFGRSFAGSAPLVAPYRAVRVTGALFHTQGGLVVDNDARVLVWTSDGQGGVLPNLYAAGGAACGVSGSKASGYLSGNGLLTAVALGRIAGAAAADAVKEGSNP